MYLEEGGIIYNFVVSVNMAPPRGSAAYKKKDGILIVSKDGQSVSWIPAAPPDSKPVLTLSVSSITSKSIYCSTFRPTKEKFRSSTDTSF